MAAAVFPDNTVLCNFAAVHRLDLLEGWLPYASPSLSTTRNQGASGLLETLAHCRGGHTLEVQRWVKELQDTVLDCAKDVCIVNRRRNHAEPVGHPGRQSRFVHFPGCIDRNEQRGGSGRLLAWRRAVGMTSSPQRRPCVRYASPGLFGRLRVPRSGISGWWHKGAGL